MAFSLTSPNQNSSESRVYPVVALREGVVFPHTEAHLTFGRPKSASAIETAVKGDKQIVFVAQRNNSQNPEVEDVYEIGTLCTVEQVAPYGNELLALVKGISRVRIGKYTSTDPYFAAPVEVIAENTVETDGVVALSRQILTEFKNSFNLGKSVEFPVFMRLMAGVSAAELTDQVANSLEVATNIKQEILETFDLQKRLEKVLAQLVHETKILELEKSISNKTHAKFERNMRQQILQERKRTIQEELEKMGAEDESDDDDIARLKKAVKSAGMPTAVKQKADKELSRLAQMSPNNPESNYIRTYLDWLVDMPWSDAVKNRVSLDKAAEILDAEHYGLKKVKERILEYLAVMKLRQKQTQQSDRKSMAILCFAGPPGVGKTSIGKSIAKALGRKFVRVSLGGIRDEAEIRGHRRTYVGAMPGRIIQGIKNSKSKNPVFMLDEIDKLASDYRGDPSSALLEALDPEQNREFSDHYLEVPYDLSEVMFIATANMLENIPPALRDRMEIITFPGYTLDEKAHIAANHLWPKQLDATGLPSSYTITPAAVLQVIRRYTREAGVRDLERQLAKICRKIARDSAEKKPSSSFVVDLAEVRKFLGPEKLPETIAESLDQVGISTGMSWSETGGDILFIEVALMPGRGELKLTGQLGDVMKESAQAAYSYVRSRWDKLGLKADFYRRHDIHVHVPEGAIPKDGPSAGVAMTTALVSAFTNRPVRKDVSMTGEITLRGRVTEIGGVKEKVIAAHRAGIKEIILPKDNEKDVIEDVPNEVRNDLKFHFVANMDEALAIALKDAPAPAGHNDSGDDRPLRPSKKSIPSTPLPVLA